MNEATAGRKRTTVRYTCALCGGSTVETTIYARGVWVCETCRTTIEDKEGLYSRLYTIFIDPKTRWYTQETPIPHKINMMATCVLKRTSRSAREKRIIHLIGIIEVPTSPTKRVDEL